MFDISFIAFSFLTFSFKHRIQFLFVFEINYTVCCWRVNIPSMRYINLLFPLLGAVSFTDTFTIEIKQQMIRWLFETINFQ